MIDQQNLDPPPVIAQILWDTEALDFRMASDLLTGSLLRTLAASKPACHFLEIGTGTGLATAWLLSGMDEASRLTSIEQDASVIAVAEKHLGGDQRVSFLTEDAGRWLEQPSGGQFDLIFADAWPGKYSHLDEALGLLKTGGLYVIDDMLPQPNWPAGHGAKVEQLVGVLEQRSDLLLTRMAWSTGIVIAVKTG